MSDWNRVHEVCNRINKRAQWCEDLSIAGGTKEINSQDEVKITIREDTRSSSTISKVCETAMDDLIKGIQLSRRLQQIKPMK